MPKIKIEKHLTYPDKTTSVVIRFVYGIFHFDLQKAGSAGARDLEIPVAGYIFPGGSLKIPMQAAETSVISIAMCIWYKSGDTIIDHPRWRAGRIITSLNIVDGEITRFEYPGKAKPTPPPPEEKNNDLEWEIDEE